MKVCFVFGRLSPYYTRVLRKLHEMPNSDVRAIVASGTPRTVGAAVKLQEDDWGFPVFRLKEVCVPFLYCTYRGLWRILVRERPDIVVVPDVSILAFYLNPMLRILLKVLRIRLVMQSIPFHLPRYSDQIARLSQRSEVFRDLPRWIQVVVSALRVDWLLRRAYLEMRGGAYRYVHAHLNYVDEAYTIFGSYGVPPERIFVARNSPDTDHYRAVEAEIDHAPDLLAANPYRLIHVGRLVEWKRVDMILYALLQLQRRFPRIELIVVGEGPEAPALNRLTKQLGLESRVKFVGGVHETKLLARYFRASGLYVLAGRGGLSINDAMFFGLPIVCSVCDGTEKYLVRDGENGYLFADGDVEDLANKIGRILGDSELRISMGKRSREIIDREVNIHTVLRRYQEAFQYAATCTS